MPEAKRQKPYSRDIVNARFRMGEEASFVQLAGFGDDFEHRLNAVLETSVPVPIPFGRTVATPMGTLFRTRPRRALLLLGDRTHLQRATHLANENGVAYLDLTSHWLQVEVTGGSAGACLQKLVAIDLDDGKFRPGDFVQTESHGIPVLLQRTGHTAPSYKVYTPRTWIASFAEMLEEALRPL